MNENILIGLIDAVERNNQIQEGIKREMELQNDLKVNDMLNDERFYNRDFIEMDINDVTREKLHTKLSDEDRYILERYREMNTNSNDELELYSITIKGFPRENERNKMYKTVEKLHLGILYDIYTERELYRYFERVIERSGNLLNLEECWEFAWKDHKVGMMDNDEKGTYFDFRGFDKEEEEEHKQEFMDKYENRMTKGYFEKKKEKEDKGKNEIEKLIQEREERKKREYERLTNKSE